MVGLRNEITTEFQLELFWALNQPRETRRPQTAFVNFPPTELRELYNVQLEIQKTHLKFHSLSLEIIDNFVSGC